MVISMPPRLVGKGRILRSAPAASKKRKCRRINKDGVFGRDRCPWQNPFVERFVGTLRRELLDHVIVLGQGHLERLLREFIHEYYHPARQHQSLDGDTPTPQPKTDSLITGRTRLISTPILGGLHHRYQPVAA
jgi:hypothetical protein